MSSQTSEDIPDTFSLGKLTKHHRKKLAPAIKFLNFIITLIT